MQFQTLLKNKEMEERGVNEIKKKKEAEKTLKYNEQLKSLLATKNHASAEGLYEEMMALKIPPNLTTYTLMLKCYSDGGKISEFLLLLKDMKKREVKLGLLISFISIFAHFLFFFFNHFRIAIVQSNHWNSW